MVEEAAAEMAGQASVRQHGRPWQELSRPVCEVLSLRLDLDNEAVVLLVDAGGEVHRKG